MGGPGPETTLGQCEACGAVYTLRVRGDGAFQRLTADGACDCGNETFRELAPEDLDGPSE
ncbi:hypothetical protein [Halocalculus aciditolerans]|uniref:Uncharacterized protein n=1 Tax=Halocalculus aciditolerans TaxID=1383812 RepID=A0A830FKR5_9EURY|nr:hypothetical protein [Halocalculus aciditolerans]GGL65762.1 hypothetical protein GCM10009039_24570 [Halocalculus aciditolerans]